MNVAQLDEPHKFLCVSFFILSYPLAFYLIGFIYQYPNINIPYNIAYLLLCSRSNCSFSFFFLMYLLLLRVMLSALVCYLQTRCVSRKGPVFAGLHCVLWGKRQDNNSSHVLTAMKHDHVMLGSNSTQKHQKRDKDTTKLHTLLFLLLEKCYI